MLDKKKTELRINWHAVSIIEIETIIVEMFEKLILA